MTREHFFHFKRRRSDEQTPRGMNALIKCTFINLCVADNIRPVSLPKRSDVIKTFAKEKAYLTGWGFTQDGLFKNQTLLFKTCICIIAGTKANTMLTKGIMTIIDLGDCWKTYGEVVTYQTMCTAGKDVNSAVINTCFVSTYVIGKSLQNFIKIMNWFIMICLKKNISTSIHAL